MSDPRYTDPRYTDPRRPPESDPAAMRRFDLERDRSSGAKWGWAAAIFALIVVMALVIGYNRQSTVATNAPNTQSAPSTTGAAPPAPRTPTREAAPTFTPPPASKPADSGPAPAPAPAEKQPENQP